MKDLYYAFPSHSMDIQEKVSHLRERATSLAKAAELTKEGHIKSLAELYSSFAGSLDLLSRNLPYKKGDRVVLTKAPKCEGGWEHSKHFLVVGAVGTVKIVEVDYLMRDVSVYVEFDDESWVCAFDYKDYETGKQYRVGDIIQTKPERRHVYGFGFDWVEHVSAAVATQTTTCTAGACS